MTDFNDRRPGGRIWDLGEHVRQNDEAWKTATPDQKADAHKAYQAAGWKTCGHKTCPPWSCQKKSKGGPAPWEK